MQLVLLPEFGVGWGGGWGGAPTPILPPPLPSPLFLTTRYNEGLNPLRVSQRKKVLYPFSGHLSVWEMFNPS